MEIKLFGKSLFEFKGNKGDAWVVPSQGAVSSLKFIPDFKKMGNGGSWASNQSLVEWQNVAVISDTAITKIETKKEVKKEKVKLTPKRVYEMQMLHDKSFKINMEPKYIDEQIQDFKSKLGLMNDPGYNHR